MTGERTLPALIDSAPVDFIVGGFLARYPTETRKLYRIHLRQWFEWCHAHGLDPMQAQRAHIEAWARHLLEERHVARSTTAAKLNAVCGMYKFAAMDGFLPVNPAAFVRRPKIDFVSSAQGLSRPQLSDILREAEQEGPMTYALICLLGLNGLRVGELLAADIEHLGYERGYRTIHLPNRKGGKVMTLSLAVRTAWAVEQIVRDRTSGPILLGRNGQRMQVAAVRRTIRRLCRKCGITKRVTPHSFRHTMVTLSLDAGATERDLMAATGHSSSKMIAYYDRNRVAIERNPTHLLAAFVGAAS